MTYIPLTPDEQKLKDKLQSLQDTLRADLAAPDCNPYFLLQKLQRDVEWISHEIIVEARKG